ncbi:MAG: hypothetical protein P1U81_07035 [Verrucomicrobiales bacterium]|nr:hypothetical protein [Verrucomicrobiales bacterium]
MAEAAAFASDDQSYNRIVTRDGREFHDCRVKRAYEEGLVIEHTGGGWHESHFSI